MLNFMKILLVGTDLLDADGRTDGRTDMTQLIVNFWNYYTVVPVYNYYVNLYRTTQQ